MRIRLRGRSLTAGSTLDSPGNLREPMGWSRPRMIFVNSMSDLFHEEIPQDYIVLVARVMAAAEWHTYQVLTKRSGRLRDMLRGSLGFAARLPHIWWEVSVENRRHGLPRIGHLRQANPAVAFLSVEPLLEDLGTINLDKIDWVILGGESGPGARPLKREWVVGVRDQCRTAGVPFFFKQWGGVRKCENGRELDGRTHDEFPPLERRGMPSPTARRQVLLDFESSSPPLPLTSGV